MAEEVPTQVETEAEPIERLRKMVKGIRIAMLTTVGPDGRLHARPMATEEITPEAEVWMFTSADSAKAGEILHDGRVSVTWARPGTDHYVCASGVAEIVDDRAKMQSLWNPLYRAWFPEGLDDPTIRLVHVRLERAEWWAPPGRNLNQAVGFVKALVSGQRWEPPSRQHGRVDIRAHAPSPPAARTVGGQTGGHEQGAPRVDGTPAKRARTKKKAPT
ncbi:MAG: pyridoxamine 5'-phosphate oxidase family protein [Myxococcota bacterium]